MKKYKLLKDLPDLKAGAILYVNGCDGGFFYDGGEYTHPQYMYSEETVYSQPEWFEEVKEDECLYSIIKGLHCYGYSDPIEATSKYIDINYIEKDKIRELMEDKTLSYVDTYLAIKELIK